MLLIVVFFRGEVPLWWVILILIGRRHLHCFSLGSGAISWSSKKQPTIALSSTEAEYRAACSAATEAVWLWRLLHELCAPQSSSTLIWCDNQSCIAIAKNPVFHARTKHIEVHYDYIREQILLGNLHLSYCPT